MRNSGIFAFDTAAVGAPLHWTTAAADSFGFARAVARAKTPTVQTHRALAEVPKLLCAPDHSTHPRSASAARSRVLRSNGARRSSKCLHAAAIDVANAIGEHGIANPNSERSTFSATLPACVFLRVVTTGQNGTELMGRTVPTCWLLDTGACRSWCE